MLASPAQAFPSIFENTIFQTFPYLLPNLVCTFIVVLGLTVGVLFLEETHEDLKFQRDRGREVGQWILNKVWGGEIDEPLTDKDGSLDEMRSMLDGPGSPAYRSTNSSPTLYSSRTSIAEPPPFSLEKDAQPTIKVREAFTKQVCLNIIGYGFLAL